MRLVSLAAALSLAPTLALAGGPQVDALAEAALDRPEDNLGGSLLGPAEARATWFSLGSIVPFSPPAMALFSTGTVNRPLVPGTDLSAVGVDDDISGVNFSLLVPEDMRSLRFAVRVAAPPESLDDPNSLDDRVRIEVRGDPIALDPWLLEDLFPDSIALAPDTKGLLDGTDLEGALLSGWVEAVVPVVPNDQVPVLFSVRDGGESALGDFVMMLDGVRFDAAIPNNVSPGVVPQVDAFGPTRLPEGLSSTMLLEGRDLPRDLTASLVDDQGVPVLELGAANVDWRSRERVILTIPALEAGAFGLRVGWGDGASLTWPDALRIDTPPPAIGQIRPDTSAPTGGGLAVLEGTGLYDVSSLRVGDAEVTNFEVISAERLEFVVPPGEPGAQRVLLIASGGSTEIAQGILYAAPESAPVDDTPPPAGPTVACAVVQGPSPWALALLVPFTLRRRR